MNIEPLPGPGHPPVVLGEERLERLGGRDVLRTDRQLRVPVAAGGGQRGGGDGGEAAGQGRVQLGSQHRADLGRGKLKKTPILCAKRRVSKIRQILDPFKNGLLGRI